MQRIISSLVLLAFVIAVFPQGDDSFQDDTEKHWSDLSTEYTEPERQQLRERWTELETELIAESLRFGKKLPSYVHEYKFSKRDEKLLKELGVNTFDHRIKNYDLRGINFQSQDLSNINLNLINIQSSSLGGAI